MEKRTDPPSNDRRSKGLLKEQLELVKTKTADGKSRYTIAPLSSELSFDKGFYVFVRAIQLLTERNKGTVVLVGLAGPSGSGKTCFTKKVQAFLPGAAVLSLDMWNDGSKVLDQNFDDPRIIDYPLLLKNLKDLREGRPTDCPIYDFKLSRRTGYQTMTIPESRVLILEGIYALSHHVRPHLDLRVSINGGVHRDLVKRVLRDIDRSGQAPEDIIQQISETVYPMYKAWIEPDLRTAQLRINNSFNPFSGFLNATYILKSARHVSREDITAVLQQSDNMKVIESEIYDIYLLPPNEDPETCSSWIRMRSRDGRYNLMFEEWVVEGNFIISPRITFEVPAKILGGLMALGYEIGTIMRRTSEVFSDNLIEVKLDNIEGMDKTFVQVQGKDRDAVAKAASQLKLDKFITHSYIELVQIENLTSSFQNVTEDLKKRFAVNGEPLFDESVVGSFSRGTSPGASSSFRRTIAGFNVPKLSSSAPPISAPISVTRPPSGRNGLLSRHIASNAGSASPDRESLADANGDWDDTATGSSQHEAPVEAAARMLSGPLAAAARIEEQRARAATPPLHPSLDRKLSRLVASQATLQQLVEDLAAQVARDQVQRKRLTLPDSVALCSVACAAAVAVCMVLFRGGLK